jgi:hypothetical protein
MEQCYVSFQTFFTFEQMILDQPAMITDNRWRYRSSAAVDDFGATCGALADLPDAPRVYQELKHWLDLSASEAAAAQTSFTAALNAGVDGAFPMQEISDTTTHLMNFIEYTHKAENVLQGARDMINL